MVQAHKSQRRMILWGVGGDNGGVGVKGGQELKVGWGGGAGRTGQLSPPSTETRPVDIYPRQRHLAFCFLYMSCARSQST